MGCCVPSCGMVKDTVSLVEPLLTIIRFENKHTTLNNNPITKYTQCF